MDWQNSMENDSNTHGRLWFLLNALFSRVSISLVVAFAIITSTVAPVARATKDVEARYAKVPAKPVTNTQSGARVTFYGPHQFTREAGSPVTVTEQFSIPSGIIAPYTIEVQNGGPGGWQRVSSASIQLNGVELFTQNKIEDNTPVLSRTVTLQSSNVLAVELTSSIGSFLTISVSGIQTVLPPASLVSIDPIRTARPRLVDARNLEDYIPCPRPGVWEPLVDLGAGVQNGELIGRLHDFADHTAEPLELRAHRNGVLIMMCATASCKQGVTLYVIARDA